SPAGSWVSGKRWLRPGQHVGAPEVPEFTPVQALIRACSHKSALSSNRWPRGERRLHSTVLVWVGMLNPQSPGSVTLLVDAFRKGLAETGYIEGQNVAIEYRWAAYAGRHSGLDQRERGGGWAAGRNARIDYRWAADNADRRFLQTLPEIVHDPSDLAGNRS